MTFYEHCQAIQAAFEAAQADGYRVEVDLLYDRTGMVELIQVDLWDNADKGFDIRGDYVTVYEEDWRV